MPHLGWCQPFVFLFPLEVTASSSLLRSRNGQYHSKFYACAAAVRTSEFAFLVVLLRKSLQEAFVAILADELVMRHATPLVRQARGSSYPLAAQMPISAVVFSVKSAGAKEKALQKSRPGLQSVVDFFPHCTLVN